MPTFRITVNATGAQVDGDYAAPAGMSAWAMAQEAGDVPAGGRTPAPGGTSGPASRETGEAERARSRA